MTVYFLRHADAENMAASDFERNLTPKGLEQAAKVGRFCKVHGLVPDKILTSPLNRARQTADIVGKDLGAEPVVQGWLACGMGIETLLKELAEQGEVESILVVGHEPDFSSVISKLIGASEGGGVLVTKASLTAIRCPWIGSDSGQLKFSIPVRLM
jgi:phosphohistidine phosphatase